MSIAFDVGDKCVTDTVNYDNAMGSQLVNDIVSIGTCSEHIIPFPSKYLTVADNYVNFLNCKPTYIRNRDKLQLCFGEAHLWFEMESYFHDSNYFDHLIKRLLMNWSLFSPIVYDKLSVDIREEVLINLPLNFLTIAHLKNKRFMNQWLQLNQTKTMIVNMFDEYHVDINTNDDVPDSSNNSNQNILVINSYCHNRDKNISLIRLGYSTQTDNLVYVDRHYDGKKHGLWQQWYINGKPESECYYDNDNYTGTYKEWFDDVDNNLSKQCSFVNDRLHGPYTEWNIHNHTIPDSHYHVSSHGNYHHGKYHGLWKRYYDTGEPKEEITYEKGHRHGPAKLWYCNHNSNGGEEHVRQEGQYCNGVKDGIWDVYDNNNLAYQITYHDGTTMYVNTP